MNIYEIIFSPTGGTKKVADFLARELGSEMACVDLSDRQGSFDKVSFTDNDVAIVAVPSYSGRVPATAAERISKINGNGAKAILVCVYGNRAYEDTLVELQDIVQQAGFTVVSAIEKIGGKLEQKDFSTPAIPGHRPYRKAGNIGIVPKATKACTRCGLCASRCPVSAIDMGSPSKVDKKVCISCMRCVSICPHNAREVNRLLMVVVNMMLKKTCSTRKDCNLFM